MIAVGKSSTTHHMFFGGRLSLSTRATTTSATESPSFRTNAISVFICLHIRCQAVSVAKVVLYIVYICLGYYFTNFIHCANCTGKSLSISASVPKYLFFFSHSFSHCLFHSFSLSLNLFLFPSLLFLPLSVLFHCRFY